MTLARVFCALIVCFGVTLMTRAMSDEPTPIGVSYATGAYAAAPVIYKLTVNGRVLSSPRVTGSGADKMPPVDGGTYSTSVQRLPSPADTKLDINVEWTEIWSGRQYTAKTQLDEDLFPWFEGGIRLNMTFEQNGGFVIRMLSEERWEEAMTMTSSGPLTFADYINAFETCAALMEGPSLSEAEVEQMLGAIWAVDMERLQANRNRPLPTPRCANPEE